MGDSRLSDSEYYIMEQFWRRGAMKTDELGQLVAEKNWKPTTLLTFLSRLVAKGMLRTEKQGKANLYTPLVGQAEYRRQEGKAFLDELYGGSTRDFLAAMVDGQGISAEELAELRAWLDDQEVDGHE